jgi:hypothetical protein
MSFTTTRIAEWCEELTRNLPEVCQDFALLLPLLSPEHFMLEKQAALDQRDDSPSPQEGNASLFVGRMQWGATGSVKVKRVP